MKSATTVVANAICSRPEGAGDVISGEDVENLRAYVSVNLWVAGFSCFRENRNQPFKHRRRYVHLSPVFWIREQTRSPPIGWARQKSHASKMRPKAVGGGIFGCFRTSINADWKQLATSYPMWLTTRSAWMSCKIWQHYVKQFPNYSTFCRPLPFYALMCSI